MPSWEKDQFDRKLERASWRAFAFGLIIGAAAAVAITLALISA